MSVCERESWGVGEHYMGAGEGDPRPGSGLGEMSEVRGQGPGLEGKMNGLEKWGRGSPLNFSSPQP